MQKKLLIWGTGRIYEFYINSSKYYELTHDISVIGITSKENCYTVLDGIHTMILL